MCGVVFDFGSACMDCGKTGEVGTDDLRKRDPSGGRGDSREAFPKLETRATGKICRRLFVYAGWVFLLEEKVRRSNLEPWQDRGYPELWDGEKEKRSF